MRPSREMMARIVRALAGFHPRSIALDIAFLDPKDAEADAELADALKAAPASSRRSECSTRPTFRRSSRAERIGLGAEAVLRSLADRRDSRCGAGGACQRFDRLERRTSLYSDDLSNARRRDSVFRARRGVARRLGRSRSSVPTGSRSRASREQWTSAITCPCVSTDPREASGASAPLRSCAEDLDPEALRGKVVVVGITATGAADTFATPFDRVAPGAEVFATAISNLMAGDGLARTPSTRRIDAAAAVALPVVMIALMAMRRAAIGLALAGLVFVLWLAGVFLAFVNGYWLSVAAPLASVAPLAVGFAAARSIVERRAGTKIAAEKSTLAKFQSPLLLDQFQREPDFLEKPVRQDVAVMFLDLSGSTGVAEALGPERTRDLFSAMQTLVEGEVTAHGGVVINYMGDGVLAVFGLPKPRSDDAARALATVEALRKSMTAWLAELPPAARDRLDFRIGLHFGPGDPVPARFADPAADHRHGRYGQRREPASGSGQAAALPRRRHGRSFPGRKRADAIGERQRRLRGADRFDSRSSKRFAGSDANFGGFPASE